MEIFKCKKCGNTIEFITNNGPSITCCGEIMEPLEINTSEASGEKHLPIYEIMDKKIKVSVGEILHPMEENHNIAWITLVSDKKIIKKILKPGDSPVVKFPYIQGSTIYAYCGVHGIFRTEVK